MYVYIYIYIYTYIYIYIFGSAIGILSMLGDLDIEVPLPMRKLLEATSSLCNML